MIEDAVNAIVVGKAMDTDRAIEDALRLLLTDIEGDERVRPEFKERVRKYITGILGGDDATT